MRRLRRLLATVVATCAAACGAPEARVSVTLPWPAALSCADPTQLANMEAALTIASYAPCPLTVQADLSVTGNCPDVATNVVRSLLVEYFLPQVSAPHVPLAFTYGTVDLTENGPLESDTRVLRVTLGESLLITPEQVAALPASASRDDPPSVKTPAWARQVVEAEEIGLDLDCDSTANLLEACAGTLFPASGTCP